MSYSNPTNALQIDSAGNLCHFLDIEGLSAPILKGLLDKARTFIAGDEADHNVKTNQSLMGRMIANMFFEDSTRTRNSFTLASQHLGANTLDFNPNSSSLSKGETLIDTIRTIESMGVDCFILRHREAGAAHFVAQQVKPNIAIINAGDGQHAHPTQAMLDMLTIQQHKGDIDKLVVALTGDILHSRVARSQIYALQILGCAEIRVITPKTLLPKTISQMGVHVFHDMQQGLQDVDVIIALRVQHERMESTFLPGMKEFHRLYGLHQANLQYAKPDSIVMHPAPFNRGVEISSEVADGPQSVIFDQVYYGVIMRMAILSTLFESAIKGG